MMSELSTPPFSGKGTVHVEESHTDPPAHPPASLLTISTAMHKPCHHFHIPNFKLVTLSPQVFQFALIPEPKIY